MEKVESCGKYGGWTDMKRNIYKYTYLYKKNYMFLWKKYLCEFIMNKNWKYVQKAHWKKNKYRYNVSM